MYIQEFIQQYCRDMLQTRSAERELFNFNDDLEYDDIVYDIDNKPIRVVFVDNLEVPVTDIVSMDKESFLHCYNSPHAGEMYDNYLASMEFLYGEEAMAYLRNQIRHEAERLSRESKLVETWSDLNS